MRKRNRLNLLTCLALFLFVGCAPGESTALDETSDNPPAQPAGVQDAQTETEASDLPAETPKPLWKLSAPTVNAIKVPVAGCYPQGMYKYPKTNYTQSLEWVPAVSRAFEADTVYTAKLTLAPQGETMTFEGVELSEVRGLPKEGVSDISSEMAENCMIIYITYPKTAETPVEPELLFCDDFDGDELDRSKWAICPAWDRQGRSTWSSDQVSVDDGYLRLGFVRDEELGKKKTKSESLAKNWLRSGGIRTLGLFENTFGYYEARIKFPKVQGMWGAFWLMSQTQSILTDAGVIGTEIDIVESIANPQNKFNAALHWNGYGSEHRGVGSGDTTVPGIDIYDGEFHVFALEWTPVEYVFLVDGQVFWRADGGSSNRNCGINQNPNYIKLTVEGAEYAGLLPSDFTEGEMLVDYVKVYNGPPIQ